MNNSKSLKYSLLATLACLCLFSCCVLAEDEEQQQQLMLNVAGIGAGRTWVMWSVFVGGVVSYLFLTYMTLKTAGSPFFWTVALTGATTAANFIHKVMFLRQLQAAYLASLIGVSGFAFAILVYIGLAYATKSYVTNHPASRLSGLFLDEQKDPGGPANEQEKKADDANERVKASLEALTSKVNAPNGTGTATKDDIAKVIKSLQDLEASIKELESNAKKTDLCKEIVNAIENVWKVCKQMDEESEAALNKLAEWAKKTMKECEEKVDPTERDVNYLKDTNLGSVHNIETLKKFLDCMIRVQEAYNLKVASQPSPQSGSGSKEQTPARMPSEEMTKKEMQMKEGSMKGAVGMTMTKGSPSAGPVAATLVAAPKKAFSAEQLNNAASEAQKKIAVHLLVVYTPKNKKSPLWSLSFKDLTIICNAFERSGGGCPEKDREAFYSLSNTVFGLKSEKDKEHEEDREGDDQEEGSEGEIQRDNQRNIQEDIQGNKKVIFQDIQAGKQENRARRLRVPQEQNKKDIPIIHQKPSVQVIKVENDNDTHSDDDSGLTFSLNIPSTGFGDE